MINRTQTIRAFLLVGLVLSIVFSGFAIYYKIHNWGFNVNPKKRSNVWTVEEHATFMPTGDDIKISIARPTTSNEFKILAEEIMAPGYDMTETDEIITLTTSPKEEQQDIYYRVVLYDNIKTRGNIPAPPPPVPDKPIMGDEQMTVAVQVLELAKNQKGDDVQQIINLFNQTPPDSMVQAFLPARKSAKETAETISAFMDLKGIPNRIARGVRLVENKKTFVPDVMIEGYIGNDWHIYSIDTAQRGIPKDFVIFQRGGKSLMDIEGGIDSSLKFSVLKSIRSSFNMAGDRAKQMDQQKMFDASIYSLPLPEQNALKWLTIFPLAIFIVAIMRNVVGIKTMGTFTPMLISMALIQTGFWAGLICFTLIIGVGLLVRALLSKLNLLLVPRISAVVIFVILIIQALTVIGYRFHFDIASSALFFPIIIMAWIIERASITWEEEGMTNALKEILFSILVAIITYFIIVNEYIRHIMFAFNELNLVILFMVMLLGTYTGYRLTELKRFASLTKGGGKDV